MIYDTLVSTLYHFRRLLDGLSHLGLVKTLSGQLCLSNWCHLDIHLMPNEGDRLSSEASDVQRSSSSELFSFRKLKGLRWQGTWDFSHVPASSKCLRLITFRWFIHFSCSVRSLLRERGADLQETVAGLHETVAGNDTARSTSPHRACIIPSPGTRRESVRLQAMKTMTCWDTRTMPIRFLFPLQHGLTDST